MKIKEVLCFDIPFYLLKNDFQRCIGVHMNSDLESSCLWAEIKLIDILLFHLDNIFDIFPSFIFADSQISCKNCYATSSSWCPELLWSKGWSKTMERRIRCHQLCSARNSTLTLQVRKNRDGDVGIVKVILFLIVNIWCRHTWSYFRFMCKMSLTHFLSSL